MKGLFESLPFVWEIQKVICLQIVCSNIIFIDPLTSSGKMQNFTNAYMFEVMDMEVHSVLLNVYRVKHVDKSCN